MSKILSSGKGIVRPSIYEPEYPPPSLKSDAVIILSPCDPVLFK